ncbi:hypothetical protein AYI71_06470 [Limosilactobacillus oris]|nr:hypothetical protein AYI71_06470 [Limosilactobacillus oris]
MLNNIKSLYSKFKQFIQGALCIVVLIFGFILIKHITKEWTPFITWFHTDHGSVADWAGSIGTIAAFLAVFWQVKKQGSIERAIDVERSRPRFSVLFSLTLPKGTRVLYWNRTDNDANNIISNPEEYRFITIQNISSNVIYDFDVILRYHTLDNSRSRNDFWSTTGVFPKKTVTFIPKFKGKNNDQQYVYDELLVKFTTPANEVGFFRMINVNDVKGDLGLGSGRYYFVKGTHIKGVKAINKDRMIKINSDECQRFDSLFEDFNYSTNTIEV